MDVRFGDEIDGGFGWITGEAIPRTSHALASDVGVWLLDPVDAPGVEERVRELGEPRGVIQLLDRHGRDSGALAGRLGIPHHEVPFDGVAEAPFQAIRVARSRFWAEIALWWPERAILVCADALGTLGYFLAPGERLGVHPFLRVRPPRRLAGLEPRHVLVGHGEGIHGDDAPAVLGEALATARRRLPRAYVSAARGLFRRSNQSL